MAIFLKLTICMLVILGSADLVHASGSCGGTLQLLEISRIEKDSMLLNNVLGVDVVVKSSVESAPVKAGENNEVRVSKRTTFMSYSESKQFVTKFLTLAIGNLNLTGSGSIPKSVSGAQITKLVHSQDKIIEMMMTPENPTAIQSFLNGEIEFYLTINAKAKQEPWIGLVYQHRMYNNLVFLNEGLSKSAKLNLNGFLETLSLLRSSIFEVGYVFEDKYRILLSPFQLEFMIGDLLSEPTIENTEGIDSKLVNQAIAEAKIQKANLRRAIITIAGLKEANELKEHQSEVSLIRSYIDRSVRNAKPSF